MPRGGTSPVKYRGHRRVVVVVVVVVLLVNQVACSRLPIHRALAVSKRSSPLQYLLGLQSPWTVRRVHLNVNGQRVDVWAEHPEDAECCAENMGQSGAGDWRRS
jgi:hypothetical protein